MGKLVLAILKALLDLGIKLGELYVKLYTNIGEWALNIIKKGAEAGSNFVTSVVNYVKEIVPKVWNWLVSVITKVVEWRASLIAKGIEAGKGLVDAVVNKVKELADKMKSIGADVVKGLWNGINNTGQWLKDKISGFVGNVTDWLKSFFGINSPSKLMADEVGKFLPQGIAVGIDKNAKSVMESMKNVTMGAVSGARAGLVTGGSVSTSGAVGVAGGVVNNFYQTNNSPKALSRLEIYRQSKNLLGLAGGV